MIKTAHHAKNFVERQHSTNWIAEKNSVVVGEHGDIHANCDVDSVCAEHEGKKEKFFILKGERTEVKKSKKAE